MHPAGLHHVTAIAGPAERNLAFHRDTLGLRLVKKTVNFDDPGTYHLYYGDGAGQPGTVLTFFPWPHVAPGHLGVGEVQETMFRVPEGSLGYWTRRFVAHGVPHQAVVERFGERVLPFKDFDGMRLALVEVPGAADVPAWDGGGVPAEHALRGFHGVSLALADTGPTGAVLDDVFWFGAVGQEKGVSRFQAAGVSQGGIVDLLAAEDLPPSRPGGGSVHHIAFRAPDDAAQAAMVQRLAENHGITATAQKDRKYFRSVYFREPGHVLFEIATDVPGFAVDEPAKALGRDLQLPAGLESRRAEIVTGLPALG